MIFEWKMENAWKTQLCSGVESKFNLSLSWNRCICLLMLMMMVVGVLFWHLAYLSWKKFHCTPLQNVTFSRAVANVKCDTIRLLFKSFVLSISFYEFFSLILSFGMRNVFSTRFIFCCCSFSHSAGIFQVVTCNINYSTYLCYVHCFFLSEDLLRVCCLLVSYGQRHFLVTLYSYAILLVCVSAATTQNFDFWSSHFIGKFVWHLVQFKKKALAQISNKQTPIADICADFRNPFHDLHQNSCENNTFLFDFIFSLVPTLWVYWHSHCLAIHNVQLKYSGKQLESHIKN